MITELTQELKARYLAQYIGAGVNVEIGSFVGKLHGVSIKPYLIVFDFGVRHHTNCTGILRSLSSLTLEEARELVALVYSHSQVRRTWTREELLKDLLVQRVGKFGSHYKILFQLNSTAAELIISDCGRLDITIDNSPSPVYNSIAPHQYLVSRGIATAYLGFSVQELIQAGWITLVEEVSA